MKSDIFIIVQKRDTQFNKEIKLALNNKIYLTKENNK
jgi:hypothetical protein